MDFGRPADREESPADVINGMVNSTLETLRNVNLRRDLFAEVARSYYNTFDALICAGFTREEALKIVCRQGGVKLE